MLTNGEREEKDAVKAWALRHIARHPLDYAAGFARRARFVVGIEPWLIAA